MTRFAPALVLFLIAPAIGEYLLGNLPLTSPTSLAAYPVLALLYGSGAVLIREIARRAGRGYPTIFGMAIGYGILEEGIVTQSLFNPDFLGLDLHSYGELPVVGMGLPWTLFVLTIHSVWSIVVPIVLVEALFRDRRKERWLNTPGVVGLVVLYLVGFGVLFLASWSAGQFMATGWQLGAAAVAAGTAFALALLLRPRAGAGSPGPVWPPVALAGFTLLVGSLVFLSYELGATARLFSAPVGVALTVLLMVTAGLVIGRQSRRAGWTEQHQLAVLTGAVLTYCWAGFLVQISQYGLHPGGVVIQVALVLGALALLWVARRRISAVPRRDA